MLVSQEILPKGTEPMEFYYPKPMGLKHSVGVSKKVRGVWMELVVMKCSSYKEALHEAHRLNTELGYFNQK
jgi:hypothetical protein